MTVTSRIAKTLCALLASQGISFSAEAKDLEQELAEQVVRTAKIEAAEEGAPCESDDFLMSVESPEAQRKRGDYELVLRDVSCKTTENGITYEAVFMSYERRGKEVDILAWNQYKIAVHVGPDKEPKLIALFYNGPRKLGGLYKGLFTFDDGERRFETDRHGCPRPVAGGCVIPKAKEDKVYNNQTTRAMDTLQEYSPRTKVFSKSDPPIKVEKK